MNLFLSYYRMGHEGKRGEDDSIQHQSAATAAAAAGYINAIGAIREGIGFIFIHLHNYYLKLSLLHILE